MSIAIILLIVIVGILVSIIAILAILAISVKGYALAAKGPDDDNIVRTIEGILGVEIGNKYEVFDKDWRFVPDGTLSCKVKIPDSKFALLFSECKGRSSLTKDSQVTISKQIEDAGTIIAVHHVTLDEKSGIILFHSFGC